MGDGVEANWSNIVNEYYTYFRLHTIERLARGGELHSIDIYLRNWSIRSELLKRAYLYSVENDSFHQPSVSAEPRQRNDSGSVSPHQLNITNGQQPADVKTYQNNSKDVNIRRDHERSASQPDLPYQKQYCNQLKTIPCDVMLADNVASPTEINTTARKTDQGDTIKIHCGKNEVMVNRCGTWSKNVRNCSERKAARDAKNAADMVATSTPMSVSEALKQKQYKMCPFNPLTTNKAPNLRTQNTFVSRLLLTDIFDNIWTDLKILLSLEIPFCHNKNIDIRDIRFIFGLALVHLKWAGLGRGQRKGNGDCIAFCSQTKQKSKHSI